MPLIAKCDFVDELSVPNESQGFGGNGDSLTRFICKYEPLFLNQLFGHDFAALFVAAGSVNPVETRWQALLTPQLKTAIASYVYYFWMRNNDSQTLGVGNAKTVNQNVVLFSGRNKVLDAWDYMLTICWDTVRYLRVNASTYPEYNVPFWAGRCYPGSTYYYQWRRVHSIPDIFYPLPRL